jgi:hypothetical protein
MDFLALPLVVLDTILFKLTLPSLLSVSRTCTTLHIHANRLLYRHPANICRYLECSGFVPEVLHCPHYGCVGLRVANRMERLELSLSVQYTNARFLRIHTSFDPKLLQATWSQLPLALTRLRLDTRWFTTSNEGEINECVTSKHPLTLVEQLFLDGPPNEDYCGLLSRLDSFRGLNKLDVHVSSFALNLHPDNIIAHLNCPQLKRLVLRCSNHLVSLRGRVPSLEILEIYPLYYDWGYVDEDKENREGPKEKWEKLVALKERGIRFMCAPFLNNEIGLLSFVFQHADRKQLDPVPLARWLIASKNHTTRREISLRRFSPPHRDTALRTIKALNFEQGYRLEIRLHDHDTVFIAHILPELITSLNLVISEYNNISPAVIPEIVHSLPNIKALSVHLYMGCLEPGQLARNASCFRSDFDFPIVTTKHPPHDLAIACQYQLSVTGGTTWRVASECDFESGEPIYVDTEIGIPNLEREVGEWLQMNPALDCITLFFDGERELFEYYE